MLMEERKRSKAGAYAWRKHQRLMLPWLPVYFVPALIYPLFLLAFVLPGRMNVWAVNLGALLFIEIMYLVSQKIDALNSRWGEGARGEFRVGEELEKLHTEGFHVFHDWHLEGRGNVDHFVVGPQGVFAIETKSSPGDITARGDKLCRNGRPVYENMPIKQAMGNALKVRKLIGDSYGEEPFVVPVLCFSRATVTCYGQVGKVEVVGLGCLNRVIVDGRRGRYSSQQVEKISQSLAERLEISPAVRPGLPPEQPGRLKKLLRPERVFVTSYVVYLLALTVVFADSTATIFEGAAGFYRFLEAMI